MKARAVRLHAANDLRLDTFELPEIRDDEILVKVVSDSICMSTQVRDPWYRTQARASRCCRASGHHGARVLRAISSRLARSIRISSSRA